MTIKAKSPGGYGARQEGTVHGLERSATYSLIASEDALVQNHVRRERRHAVTDDSPGVA